MLARQGGWEEREEYEETPHLLTSTREQSLLVSGNWEVSNICIGFQLTEFHSLPLEDF